MQLLIVEDQSEVADTLLLALRTIDSAYQITHVTTVTDALMELASGTQFDAALVDLGLPDAKSEQAPATLCKQYPDLVVVVYTGESNPNLASRIMRLGAQDFVIKGEHGPIAIDRVLRCAVERHRRERALKEAAYTDEMTGVLNRRGFQIALEAALGSERKLQLALFILDLDGFKSVNDTHGHPVGDKLLQQSAQRIAGCLRGHDKVARMGGDEFAIICEGISTAAQTTIVAQKLLDAVGAPYSINGERLTVSASLGIACAPGDATAIEALYHASDTALYEAKARGKNCYVRYRVQDSARSAAEAPANESPTLDRKQSVKQNAKCDSTQSSIAHELCNEINVVALEIDIIQLTVGIGQSSQIDHSVAVIHQKCGALAKLAWQL